MSHTITQLVSIDLGNGTTSWIASHPKADGYAAGSFASLVAEPVNTAGLGGASGREPFKLKSGEKFLVGDQCREEGTPFRSTDTSFYDSKSMKVLFLKALHDSKVKHPLVVTGLPCESYETKKASFSENLKAWARDEGIQLAGVTVIPQWAGAFFDPMLKDDQGRPVSAELLAQGKVGIIDIGHGTTDSGQFNGLQVSGKRYGESTGVSDLHRAIYTQLKKPDEFAKELAKYKFKLPKDFSLDSQTSEHTIDSWIRQGFIPWCGEKLPMSEISRPAREALASSLLPRVITKMWGHTGLLAGMVCAGGGPVVLGRELLRKYINCPIFMADDPELSVVRGYHRWYISQHFKNYAVL